MSEPFKQWAVVAVMGHKVYAGLVTEETIAGAALLRIDVPATSRVPAFTTHISPQALYSLTATTEETARAKAEAVHRQPFEIFDVKSQILQELKMKRDAEQLSLTYSDQHEDVEDPDEDWEDDD